MVALGGIIGICYIKQELHEAGIIIELTVSHWLSVSRLSLRVRFIETTALMYKRVGITA